MGYGAICEAPYPMAHIGRDEVVRRRLISGVSRKKSKEIIDEIVTRRSRWVYFCPGSTQEMAVQRSGRGIVDDHAGGVGRTGQRHRHNAMGVFLCFCQLLGELTCRDSGWLSWARFALPVASGVLSRVARFRLRGLVPGRGFRF